MDTKEKRGSAERKGRGQGDRQVSIPPGLSDKQDLYRSGPEIPSKASGSDFTLESVMWDC